MPTPVVIDTDMGVDDAVAVTLTLSADELELVGLISVGGNVPVDQVTRNIGRLLGALQPANPPKIARGLDQDAANLPDATYVHGADGLGEVNLPVPPDFSAADYLATYEELIAAHGSSLVIVAIGPLTNLAAVLGQRPGLLQQVGRVVLMGGAVWCKGNVTPYAEFNFHRDPAAAAAVLGAGLPITIITLDVSSQVAIDESHLAHLSCSGTRSGELLARMIQFPMSRPIDQGTGRFLVHDALTIGALLWPQLFLRSKMALEIVTAGEQAGRSKPMLAKDKTRQVTVAVSVNVGDFLGSMLEQLCHEKFVV